jgi:phosphoserine phosphatase
MTLHYKLNAKLSWFTIFIERETRIAYVRGRCNRMGKMKLVSFDLDDTLIREIHSVMLPCILNGKEKEHSFIQAQEEKGEINYMAADYLRAELLLGLEESGIAQSFLEIAKPINSIKNVVEALHERNIKCIVITVGPKQVAKVVCDIFGFDGYYGSEYEVVEGVFTGKILNYIGAQEKVECLQDFCKNNNIKPEECIAVGDGSTDIPIFEYCGKSIAINSSPKVCKSAMYAIETDDLIDILKCIL